MTFQPRALAVSALALVLAACGGAGQLVLPRALALTADLLLGLVRGSSGLHSPVLWPRLLGLPRSYLGGRGLPVEAK